MKTMFTLTASQIMHVSHIYNLDVVVLEIGELQVQFEILQKG